MSKRLWAVCLSLALTAGLAAGSVLGATSLWLLWSALPDTAELRVATNSNSLLAQPLLQTTSALGDWFPLTSTRALAAALKADGSTLLAIRTVFSKRYDVADRLREHGWHVTRFGPFIRATTQPENPLTWQETIAKLARVHVLGRTPLRPTLLLAATPAAWPWLNEPIEVVATGSAAHMHFLITAESDSGLPTEPAGLPASSPAAVSDLTLTLPSHYVSRLPPALQTAWNALLHQRLGLQHTTPDIASYVSQFEVTTITVRGDDAAVSVRGATDAFAEAATSWLQEDERRSRPVERAFRLPDGTVGYERVPGPVQPVLGPEQEGCSSSVIEDLPWWLCRSETTIAVGTSEALTREILAAPEATTWQFVASLDKLQSAAAERCRDGDDVTSDMWCLVRRVSLAGTDHRVAGRVRLGVSN